MKINLKYYLYNFLKKMNISVFLIFTLLATDLSASFDKIDNSTQANVGCLNLEQNFLGIKANSYKDDFGYLIQIEDFLGLRSAWIIVGENQIFAKNVNSAFLKDKVLYELENCSLDGIKSDIASIFIKYKFIKAKDLKIEDRIDGFTNIFKVKKIYNVKISEDLYLNILNKNKKYAFFEMQTIDNFYLKKFASKDHANLILDFFLIGGLIKCNLNFFSYKTRFGKSFDETFSCYGIFKNFLTGAIVGSAVGEIFWNILLYIEKWFDRLFDGKDIDVILGMYKLLPIRYSFLNENKVDGLLSDINFLKIDFLNENELHLDSVKLDCIKLISPDGHYIKNEIGKLACLKKV